MTLLPLLLAGWLAVARAGPEVEEGGALLALLPPVRALYLDGQRLEAAGDLERAEVRYRRVLELEPTWTQALVDLGRVLEARGDVEGAEAAYGRAPYEADVVAALARLFAATGRPEAAAQRFARLRELRPETAEFLLPEALSTAAFDALRAEGVTREYLGRVGAEVDAAALVPVATDVARALRAQGEDPIAASLLEAVVVALGESPDAVAAADAMAAFEALRERFAVEEEAEALAAAADAPLAPAQQAQLREAREHFGSGRLVAAEEALREILRTSPNNAETWAALSDVLEVRGDVAGAEVAIRMAEGLAPLVAAYPARLGELLAAHYGGRFDAEAADAYGRAVQRLGASPRFWLRRGQLLRRAGRPERAVLAYRRFLELAPADEPARDVRSGGGLFEARSAVEGWERQRPEPPAVPVAPGRPSSVPEDAWRAYHVAYVLYLRADGERSRLEDALRELSIARAAAPDYTRAVNLEATLRSELGEEDEAEALYTRSQELEPGQPEVLVELAQLARRSGRSAVADARLEEAAQLGSAAALVHLARRDVERWRWWSAREHLDAYFAGSTSGESYDEALALDREVDALIRLALGFGVVGTGALLSTPIVVRWRRRSGQSLEALLRASPAAWRDVARIASALRHEVLKHNTTVLASVADALEDRDPEPARWASERLYGERGAVARFRGYVQELQALGARYGVRLNLRYRDPVLGPLIEAMDQLASLEGDLSSGGTRRRLGARELPAELRELSQLLNRGGYQGLGALVRRVCLLELDDAVLREIWDEVRREPALRALPEIALELDAPAERTWVRIFRGDLHDILANLLRNAALAGAEVGSARLRVAVRAEEDDITGLERVAIRVADDGPRRISTAMIRGRYIGRGLGLAVDLVSRSGGSVHVEDELGWSKAVVVRLPRAELGDAEEG